MRNHLFLLVSIASLATAGCNPIECADGTIERDGKCEPATQMGDPAKCGAFTTLIGDQCVPMFPPTVCEDGSTTPELDPTTGVTVCKGEGGVLPCGVSVNCPVPTMASKQTICGQLYDFEDNTRFEAVGAVGAVCPATPTTTGPCALTITPYDAIAFGTNPTTATPLAVGSTYLDECGRFKLINIDTGASLFIGLGVDDATGTGPTGVTVTAAVAVPKVSMGSTKDVEAFIVKPSTTTLWASGGPTLQTGVFAPVFRAHKLGATGTAAFENQPGVTVQKGQPAMGLPNNDFYFNAAELTRRTIDTVATATGMNGTVLVNNANITADGLSYTGVGGLGTNCRWELHGGASLPGVVFIQLFHKVDSGGMTCND